jgi:hypothetical protein
MVTNNQVCFTTDYNFDLFKLPLIAPPERPPSHPKVQSEILGQFWLHAPLPPIESDHSHKSFASVAPLLDHASLHHSEYALQGKI